MTIDELIALLKEAKKTAGCGYVPVQLEIYTTNNEKVPQSKFPTGDLVIGKIDNARTYLEQDFNFRECTESDIEYKANNNNIVLHLVGNVYKEKNL